MRVENQRRRPKPGKNRTNPVGVMVTERYQGKEELGKE